MHAQDPESCSHQLCVGKLIGAKVCVSAKVLTSTRLTNTVWDSLKSMSKSLSMSATKNAASPSL